MKKPTFGFAFIFIFLLPFVVATSTSAITPRLTPAPVVSIIQPVDYPMPYPGILPDHPLYSLKMLRDKILDLIIKDPVKRIEFLLLMSDKRIAAGKMLIDGTKVSLGITTISKGENYFERAVTESEQTKKQGKNVNSQLDNLEKASQKHIEMLIELSSKVSGTTKPDFENLLSVAQKQYQKVLNLKR
ncbi:MAG: DUF5667 domain-containing protein [Candidatus Gottesmanbacteria bacterium]